MTAVAGPARAASNASCTVAATSLDFGLYVPSRNGPSDFTAELTVVCVALGTTPVSVHGTIGLIGSDGQGHQLADGRQRLRYQMFMDPARSIPWGDGAAGTQTRQFSGTLSPAAPLRASFTVYGRILAHQPQAAVGNYRDRVTAILKY